MSKITYLLSAATVAATVLSMASSGPAVAGPIDKSARGTATSAQHVVTVTHKHRAANQYSRTKHTRVWRAGRDVVVDAPTTTVERRGRRVAVDAPFAHVRRSAAGVHVRAPFVDLWVPRR